MGRKSEKYCSCGSCFPIVDLTEVFCNEAPKDTEKVFSALVKAFQYGAFHLTIDTERLAKTQYEHLIQLADDNLIIEKLEKMFEESFVTSFGSDDDSFEVICKCSDNNSAIMKYRGRFAESGSAKGDGELKQSWESMFCNNHFNAPSSSVSLDDRLNILKIFTSSLHMIGEKIFDVLGIPDFISHGECECKNKEFNCSIDLMRVFRYDAVEADKRLLHFGSSEHTDWGSLTIVWQDNIGGLQIYCHNHDRWNDVIPLSNMKDKLRLFVHVGDFTSIAISDAVSTNSKNPMLCPSPLHRVICPVSEMDSNSVRHSLVFFAYPKIGISINDASKSIKKSKIYDDLKTSVMELIDIETQFSYDRFMVLKNQSIGGDSLVDAKTVYENIRNQPFHDVIRNKWNQVQRYSEDLI